MPRRSFYVVTFVIATLPLIVSAAPRNLVDLANMLANIFNGVATFLVLAALVILFGNIARRLIERLGLGGGDTKLSKTIMWGIATLFVMVSIWGIIRILQNTLFNSGSSSAPNTSRSSPLDFTLPIIN